MRGYHPLLATCAGDSAGGGARQLLGARLRGGNAASGRGAGNFVTETLSRLRAKLPVDASGRRTAFAGTADAVEVRLVVRRVRPTPGSQLALVEVFDHHAFITDRAGELLIVEAEHRDHAVVEQVIADLKGAAGLAHLPSSRFATNTAWLALVGLAYNLARWAAALAGSHWAQRMIATIRTRLLAIPGRLVHTARRLHLRLSNKGSPWMDHAGRNNDAAHNEAQGRDDRQQWREQRHRRRPRCHHRWALPRSPSHTVGVCLDLRPLVPL